MGINLKNPKEKRVNQAPVFYHMQQYSFCDGASQGNPRPSGSEGFIILQNQKITFKRGAGINTNNYAELLSIFTVLLVAANKDIKVLHIL